MSFSKPRYEVCDECDGEGEIPDWLLFPDEIDWVTCPVCNGRGKLLDEQIPEENNSESPLENNDNGKE